MYGPLFVILTPYYVCSWQLGVVKGCENFVYLFQHNLGDKKMLFGFEGYDTVEIDQKFHKAFWSPKNCKFILKFKRHLQKKYFHLAIMKKTIDVVENVFTKKMDKTDTCESQQLLYLM